MATSDTKRRSRVKFYINKVNFVGFYAPRHLLGAVRRLLLVEHVNNQEGGRPFRLPHTKCCAFVLGEFQARCSSSEYRRGVMTTTEIAEPMATSEYDNMP